MSFDEERAERMFDRLGAGVADERPPISELVAAAKLERARRRRTTSAWLATAAATILVTGGVGWVGARAVLDPASVGVLGQPDEVAVNPADAVTGTWRTPSGEEISYLPSAVSDGVEYVSDNDSGEIGLDAARAAVSSYTRVVRPPTADDAGLTSVTSVNQITGSWDAVRVLGHPHGETRDLVVTTSWLALVELCAAHQSDYAVADGVLTATDPVTTSLVFPGDCPPGGTPLTAAVAASSSLSVDEDGRLVAFDADGVETAAFRRSDPVPGPSAPELAGRWRPVGVPDAELTLSVRPGPTAGRVAARSGDCEIAGIWYLTEDGTFVSSAGPTADSAPGCDAATPDLDAFENISRAELTDGGQLLLSAPNGRELVRYDPVA